MSKVVYDKHYQKENYFGNPYPELVTFFEQYEPKGTILDLGCGQGRDALMLGRLGYTVIGVDHSQVGIEQLREIAEREDLSICGLVGDVYSYPIDSDVDLVLMDSMLHFYKNDVEKETALVQRVLEQLKPGGVLVNVMISGKSREAKLCQIIRRDKYQWKTLLESYVDYPEFQSTFHLIVIRKET